MKGRITTERTVWCGAFAHSMTREETSPHRPQWFTAYLCQQWDQTSEQPALRHFLASGWKRSREFGWLCPACAKAKREHEENRGRR